MRPLSSATIAIRKRNGYQFNLYLPPLSEKNSKPTLTFYHLDPTIGKSIRIRVRKGLSRLHTKKQLLETAKTLVNELFKTSKQDGIP